MTSTPTPFGPGEAPARAASRQGGTAPDLVLVGNLVVDDLVFADGSTRMGQAGGAVLHAALGAALWNVRVGVVALVGDDYPSIVLQQVEARGIDMAGVGRLGPQGLRAWLLYEPAGRRFIHWRGRPSHDEASPGPGAIPRPWRSARAFHATPMPLASQAAIVDDLSALTAHLSVDPHTRVQDETLPAWRQVLSRIDAFFVSDTELLAPPAADQLLGGRLRTLLLKRGERGGTLMVPAAPPIAWPARAAAVVDPTGAGDAFAGGFLAGRLAGFSLEAALARAIVSASFAMEGWGAAALLAATPRAARERLDQWFPGDPGRYFGSGTVGTV